MRQVLLSAVLVLSFPFAAYAQGLGQRLDDPSGRVPPSPREEPSAEGAAALEGDVADESGLGNAELSDRLRALDATYAALSASAGPNWFNIVLSLASGAAQLGFGIAFTQVDDDIINALGPYFITLGMVALTRTIVVDIVMRPDPRGVALEYQHMPSITRANRLARLRYGEQQLNAIADYSFIARMVDAGLNIGGAAASMIAYFVPRDFGLRPFDWLESFIFIGPAISLVMAIVTLASPSEAEQRRDAYARLRQTLRQRRGQRVEEEGSYEEEAVPPPPRAGLSWQVGGGIDPNGGGLVAVGATF
jgi:hypothetical protein